MSLWETDNLSMDILTTKWLARAQSNLLYYLKSHKNYPDAFQHSTYYELS